MMTLHGYLSSPTGGGIRHGVDLREGLALQLDEAQLYCNLIRSYLTDRGARAVEPEWGLNSRSPRAPASAAVSVMGKMMGREPA